MPSRILKESITTSPNLDILSPLAERLFIRLIVNCDDYGRLDARPQIIRAKCFPLKLDTVNEEDIINWLTELINANLIMLYTSNDLVYLQMLTWDKHQQVRAKKSKCPNYDNTCNQMITSENITTQMSAFMHKKSNDNECNQMQSNVLVIQSNPIRNPIQSNNNVENPEQIKKTITHVKSVSEEAVKLATLLKELILKNDGRAKVPTNGNINKWAIDIDRLIRLDKRTYSEIESVIKFSQTNQFWKSNILSASALRNKFAKLNLQQQNGSGHGKIGTDIKSDENAGSNGQSGNKFTSGKYGSIVQQ